MPFDLNNNQGRLAALGAMAVPLAGIAYYFGRRRQPDHHTSPPAAAAAPSTDPESWNPALVQQWLVSIGAHPDVVVAFRADGVDGVTLPMLQDVHLEKMGVASVSQRVKILRAIRVLFHLPVSESVAATPHESPVSSLNRRQPHVDPEGAMRSASGASHDVAVAAAEAQSHAVTTLEGKMRKWMEYLGSSEFAQLPPHRQKDRVTEAAAELSNIARLLQTLPNSPPVQELRLLAQNMMTLIGSVNDAVEQSIATHLGAAGPAPPQARSALSNQRADAVEKVVELLGQFERVLSSEDLQNIPEAQRRGMGRGIGDQIVKIKENVLPAFEDAISRPLVAKCDQLLQICVRLQSDARPMSAQQPGMARGCCGGAAHVHTDAQEVATESLEGNRVSEANAAQPASLTFIVSRMRGLFEVIRSPQFLQESDPERLKASIAEIAREVHGLTQESRHLPNEQQQIVHEVARNIMEVLSKMAEAVQTGTEHTKRQQQQQQAAVGQRPRAAQHHPAAAQPEGRAASTNDVEVAQLLSKQLMAMLNVLKSDDFENAAPLEQRALAQRMKGDLQTMSRRIAQQPREVVELLEPTRLKLLEFVDTVITANAEPQEVPRAAPSAPAPAGADSDPQVMSKQLTAMLSVLKSTDFQQAQPAQKRALAVRIQRDLEDLSRRLAAQPPRIQELLAPTKDKLLEFVTAVLEMTEEEEDPDKQIPAKESVDIARTLSGQLVAMLGVLKSENFEKATFPEKRAVALGMQRDLRGISDRLRGQPKQIVELVEPTRLKLQQFVDTLLGMTETPGANEQHPTTGGAAKPASQPQSPAKPTVSAACRALIAQLNEVTDTINSEEFDDLSPSEKLDRIARAQQQLTKVVPMIQRLSGVEQQLVMEHATKINQLLRATAEPILASVEAGGEEDEEQSDEDENDEEDAQAPSAVRDAARASKSSNSAMQLVQRTQRLFQAINDDAFLDSPPPVLTRKLATMKRELQEITAQAAQLTAAERQNLIPVLKSLAGILGKVEAAVQAAQQPSAAVNPGQQARDAEDDEEVDSDADGAEDDDDDHGDPRRNEIFQMAKELTRALTTGAYTIEGPDSIEQLSHLLGLLDDCGVNNENELKIRQRYQKALETAIEALSRQLNREENEEDDQEAEADDDGDEIVQHSRIEELPDPPQPAHERLAPVAPKTSSDESPRRGNADAAGAAATEDAVADQLNFIIGRINAAESQADLEKLVPALAALSRNENAGRNRKHLALISQAVGQLQRKRAQFAQAPNVDLMPFKNTLRRIILNLRTAEGSQIPNLIHELTTLTDSNDEWKKDRETTNLVNTAIAEVSAAVKRVEGTGSGSPETKAPANASSRVHLLLTEAARRVREGADPRQFLPLAVQVSQLRDQLSNAEREALDDFEAALGEARVSRADSASSEDVLTPPNTPASPPQKAASPPKAAVPAQQQPSKQAEVGGAEEEQEAVDEDDAEDDPEETVLSVIEQIKQRIATAELRSINDVAPFAAILARLRQDPQPSPRVRKAVNEAERILRDKVAALQQGNAGLAAAQVAEKRKTAVALSQILQHSEFKSMTPEQRGGVVRKATALLRGLTAQEQQEMQAETQQLLSAIEAAVNDEEDDNEESAHDTAVTGDLAVLPRVVERLGTPDFMESCSTFEIQAIARTLSRLETAELAEAHDEFKSIVKHATKLLADRATAYTGAAKDVKAVSTPLLLTGMRSESEASRPVVRYTLFSGEEADNYTVNEDIANQFKRSPAQEAVLPEGGIEKWRGKSIAILCTFEQSPVDPESTNDTAMAETNQLAEVLEVDHGFEVVRIWGTPTPHALQEAVDSVKQQAGVARLLVFVQNPVLKSQLPPVPQHAVIFEEGQVLKHSDIMDQLKGAADHVVLVHDNGLTLEVIASLHEQTSLHLGVSVTEAAFLVANSGRCWLYDGLFTPMIIESLCVGKRTLCPEDLINAAVRVLNVSDGADGPYLTESPATALAFFAPGLATE